MLADRQQIGERLARMRAIGQQVDDRDVDAPRPCARACDGRTRAPRSPRTCRPSCARRPRPISRRVEADLLAADVDRVAAERRDRHLDRDARAGRRLLEQRGDALPGEHAAGPRRASAFHAIGAVEDARAAAPGSRSSTSRKSRVMTAPSRSTAARIATASSISASVTSSDGASRSALGGHRVDDETGVEAPLRDVLGVDARARARPRSAGRRRARRRRRRPSASASDEPGRRRASAACRDVLRAP